ncbi:alpha/beta hydrolase family protein [Williamsia deligens]|uniref:Alpha/beta hydrolase family protein n=1 Tax=Williamsia deligens TaxID=321325 RepID=A0ABW3G922_9NOCA|nr:prolyl oligopeptidase family serine peptidase [Williamsia deligens]MCP2195720.1 Alpha/beta hydrolase family protein [Williamsia deligens]
MRRVKVPYGPQESQFGHLYLPDEPAVDDPDAPSVPVVVIVHGGYWSTDFGLMVQTPVARDLAERGAIVWNVEYRRAGEDGGGWPQSGYDVTNALLALDGPVRDAVGRSLLARVDRDVSVVAHSAGGQLALWAVARIGARTRFLTIATVVAQAPASDLVLVGERGHERLAAFMGADYASTPHRYRSASPAHLDPFPAHVVVVAGDADTAVPLELSAAYVDTVTARGQSAELVTVRGEGHEAFLEPSSRSHRETLRHLGI